MVSDKEKEILQIISEKSSILHDDLDATDKDDELLIEILTAQISIIDEIYRDVEAIITTE